MKISVYLCECVSFHCPIFKSRPDFFESTQRTIFMHFSMDTNKYSPLYRISAFPKTLNLFFCRNISAIKMPLCISTSNFIYVLIPFVLLSMSFGYSPYGATKRFFLRNLFLVSFLLYEWNAFCLYKPNKITFEQCVVQFVCVFAVELFVDRNSIPMWWAQTMWNLMKAIQCSFSFLYIQISNIRLYCEYPRISNFLLSIQ